MNEEKILTPLLLAESEAPLEVKANPFPNAMPQGGMEKREEGQREVVCSVAGCTHKMQYVSSGLCGAHAHRLRRHGSVMADVPLREAHGLCNLPEYAVWAAMLQRCTNEQCKSYPAYGGRGINVCDGWMQFSSFYQDMGPRPSGRHSIERKDNDGHYEPSNCIWATPSEQQHNTRKVNWVEHDGLRLPISVWAKRVGINVMTIKKRLQNGYSFATAISEKGDIRKLRYKKKELLNQI